MFNQSRRDIIEIDNFLTSVYVVVSETPKLIVRVLSKPYHVHYIIMVRL